MSRNGAVQGPLGVAIAPGGDILAVNSLNGNLVEITPSGSQVAVKKLDTSGSPAGAGALFGLAVALDRQRRLLRRRRDQHPGPAALAGAGSGGPGAGVAPRAANYGCREPKRAPLPAE